ncbi:MAG: gamma carbonic anhydrase family protein, partial [Mycobacterium sp.]
VIPPRSMVAGVPGRVRRELSDAELAHNRHNAAVYEHLMDIHREAL